MFYTIKIIAPSPSPLSQKATSFNFYHSQKNTEDKNNDSEENNNWNCYVDNFSIDKHRNGRGSSYRRGCGRGGGSSCRGGHRSGC